MAAALGVWLVHLPALFDKTRFRGAARDCGGLTRAVLPSPTPPRTAAPTALRTDPCRPALGLTGPGLGRQDVLCCR